MGKRRKRKQKPTPQVRGEVRKRQRPHTCTKDKADMVAGFIGQTFYLKPACALAGIPYETVKGWMRKGNEEMEKRHRLAAAGQDVTLDEDKELYVYFATTVARAQAAEESALYRAVRDHAMPGHLACDENEKPYLRQGDGHLALSLLKAGKPDTWGQRNVSAKVEQDVNVNKPRADLSKLNKEELEQLRDLLKGTTTIKDGEDG